jgi:hypothetical protein
MAGSVGGSGGTQPSHDTREKRATSARKCAASADEGFLSAAANQLELPPS